MSAATELLRRVRFALNHEESHTVLCDRGGLPMTTVYGALTVGDVRELARLAEWTAQSEANRTESDADFIRRVRMVEAGHLPDQLAGSDLRRLIAIADFYTRQQERADRMVHR